MSRRRSPVFLSPVDGKVCDDEQRRKEIVRKRTLEEIKRIESVGATVVAPAKSNSVFVAKKASIKYKVPKVKASLNTLTQNLSLKQIIVSKHAEMQRIVNANLAALPPRVNTRVIDGKPKAIVLPAEDVYFDAHTGKLFNSKKNNDCRSLRETVVRAEETAKSPALGAVCNDILHVCNQIDSRLALPPQPVSVSLANIQQSSVASVDDQLISSVINAADNINVGVASSVPEETLGEPITPGEPASDSNTPGETLGEPASEPIAVEDPVTPGEPMNINISAAN